MRVPSYPKRWPLTLRLALSHGLAQKRLANGAALAAAASWAHGARSRCRSHEWASKTRCGTLSSGHWPRPWRSPGRRAHLRRLPRQLCEVGGFWPPAWQPSTVNESHHGDHGYSGKRLTRYRHIHVLMAPEAVSRRARGDSPPDEWKGR
jgi:hypothetical protein